jgi:uncharacterized protein involved in exopolysaccharide biosynthesis
VLRPTDIASSDDTQPWRQTLDENAIQSEIDRITSPKLADVVISKHNLLRDPEFDPSSRSPSIKKWIASAPPAPVTGAEVRRHLADHLSVHRDRKSYTIKIGYWSEDAVKAAAMTKTLLDTYLNEQMLKKRELVMRAVMLTRSEAELRNTAYRNSQTAVENLLMASGLADTGGQVALDHRITVLSTEAAQAHARTVGATISLKTLQNMKTAGTLENAPEVLASPTVRQLKEVLAAALSKTAVLGPETRAITTRIAEEAERIVQAAEIELGNWQQRENILQAEIKTLSEKMIERRQNEMRLEVLKGRAAFAKEAYDKAVTQMQAQQARVSALMPDAEVITDPEEPLRPAFPNAALTAIGSLLMAAMIGLLLAWRPLLALFDHLRNSPALTNRVRPTRTTPTESSHWAFQAPPLAASHAEASVGHAIHR